MMMKTMLFYHTLFGKKIYLKILKSKNCKVKIMSSSGGSESDSKIVASTSLVTRPIYAFDVEVQNQQ